MSQSKTFPQIIEETQIREASTKHSLQFLRNNPELQTLDLYTVNMSGSFLRNPVGQFTLHSVRRLEYPKVLKKPDILQLIFYKNEEPIALSFPVNLLYTPKKIIAGLQGIGITFPTTMSNNAFAKVFADYLGQQLTFGKIAALPGWEKYPTDNDDLRFLRPDTLSNSEMSEPLSKMKIDWDSQVSFQNIIEKLDTKNFEKYPFEITLLFLLRSFALLRTLFEHFGVSTGLIVHLLLEDNNTSAQRLLATFLSLYDKHQIYTLPMPQAKLREISVLHKDSVLLLTVPTYTLSQYQRNLLVQNFETLLQLQVDYAFLPVVMTDGFLNNVNPENLITIPLSCELLSSISYKKLTLLGNVSLEFVDFIGKNVNVIKKDIKKIALQYCSTHEQSLTILQTTLRLFTNFLSLHWKGSTTALLSYSNSSQKKLCKYFKLLLNDGDFVGLPELFLEALQKEILEGNLKIQSKKQGWDPDTMAEHTLLTDEINIFIPPKIFDKIVAQTFCQTHSLSILKALDKAGHLITETEHSGKRHYKKKTYYVTLDGAKNYFRFIVLNANSINFTDGPRFV